MSYPETLPVMPKATMDLYVAVKAYIEANGGELTMIHGAGVEYPQGDSSNFKVFVKCSGTKPEYVKNAPVPQA